MRLGKQGNEFKNKVLGSGMLLNNVLSEIELVDQQLSGAVDFSAIITDSRRAVPGGLFFAISGSRKDGNSYIEEAIARGVVAVISEEPLGKHFPINFVQVKDVRLALAKISKVFYAYPDEALKIIGVTGTNGKTTVTMLGQHLLGGSQSVGLIGTIRYDIGNRTLPAHRTTPESVDCFGLFSEMNVSNCTNALVEVSSHGIDQKRVHFIQMDTVVFLNLSRDHIDYHESLNAYFEVKKRLFTGELGTNAKRAIVNLDCDYGKMILKAVGSDLKCLTFSTDEQSSADFRAKSICLSAEGTSFELSYPDGVVEVSYHLLGRHNVSNVLAALAIGYSQGHAMEYLLKQLKSFTGVPGRMERVIAGQDFNVLVDYAHTGDAIQNSGEVIQEFTDGQKIIVFGCGGNRDKGKRPLMMRAALETSDVIIATSDNPRSESIDAIFEDMKGGIQNEAEAKRVIFIKDRRNAIAYAFELAKPKDCILIAGKGHEMYQELEGTMIPFDDRKVAKELIEKRFGLDPC